MNRVIQFNSHFVEAVMQSSIVSRTDRQGVITFVNENFMGISGYSKEELVGQPHSIINSRFHPREFWRNAWRTIGRGEMWRSEVCNRAKDGSIYWVDTFIYPCYDEHNKVEGYFSIRNDITQRKKQEKALLDIAWSQSHELRRPVASILGLVQLLEREENKISNSEFMHHLKLMAEELDSATRKNVMLTNANVAEL